jgi:hypothetical protein
MASIEKSESSSAVGLSLAAGIIILIGGTVSSFWHMSFLPQMGWMMGSQFASGVIVTSMIGLVFGSIVIIGAILMYKQPSQTRQWGILVVLLEWVDL